MSDPQQLLRGSLRANAAFSAVSGAVLSAGSGPVAGALGLDDSRIPLAVGLALLGFAALLVALASRAQIDVRLAMHVVWADLAWVFATLPVLWLGLLSPLGAIAAVIVADVVLLFALLQYLGVRRIRGGAPAPSPAH